MRPALCSILSFWTGQSSLLRPCLSSSSSSNTPAFFLLPVGVFVDLDNVSPLTHSRADAKAFAGPLKTFCNKVGQLETFQAFGNRATQTFLSRQEKERRQQGSNQEFMPWDGEVAQTGVDNDGILRCGVCGAKMKLTKKSKASGVTAEEKLRKHMKTLHDGEQAKRRNRPGKLKEKEQEKYRKYNAAQIGALRRTSSNSNELFRVLGEQGIKCNSSADVDASLKGAARKWMKSLGQNKREQDPNSGGGLLEARGCLVIVLEDSDFVPLLNEARSHSIVAVSVTPNDEQTRKLVGASDIVLKRKPSGEEAEFEYQACSSKGVELLTEMIDMLNDDLLDS